MKVTRPALRYHGGKWKLAPWLLAHMPEHRVYVEPFGGAASVLLRKPRSYAEIYNDLDGEVVNLFRVLRNPTSAKELVSLVQLTPYARDEFRDSYAVAGGEVEQARRTVVRSMMGFGSAAASGANTGFRKTSNRSGTTPAHDWVNLPASLSTIASRLAGVVIENDDAVAVMRYNDGPDTLHFVDPPYVLDTRSMKNPHCRKGYRFEMTDEEHRRLADALHALKGMVMLSGYPSALYDELYAGWERIERKALADGARERTECLWFNPSASARRPQSELFRVGAR